LSVYQTIRSHPWLYILGIRLARVAFMIISTMNKLTRIDIDVGLN
jgi:hypothetical protein